MARKMKAPRARRAHKQVTASTRAQQMLRSTVDALTAAEQEVEKQVKGLLKRNRIKTKMLKSRREAVRA